MHHFNTFERDEPILDHLIEYWEDGIDPGRLIDHLDDQRKVLGQAQDAGGMEVALGAEALDASDYGCASESFFTQTLNDRLIEGLPVPRVGLADEDAQQFSFALKSH